VAEREEGQLLIAFAELGDEVGIVQLEQNVPVAQHRALWGPGRAGRVDQDGQVIMLRDLHHLVVGARVLPVVARAQLEQRGQRQHLVIAEIVQSFHVVDDDLHQFGTAPADLKDLVQLLLVLREEEARPAVVHDVLDLAGRVCRVDAVGDAADGQGAEVRVQPLRAVVGQDRDDVARPQAEGDQPEPEVPGPLAVLAPADGAPDPELLLPHGDLVPALGHDVPEQLGQGILPVHSKHPTLDRSSSPFHRSRGNTHRTLLIARIVRYPKA
jgi:hypothetical protein